MAPNRLRLLKRYVDNTFLHPQKGLNQELNSFAISTGSGRPSVSLWSRKKMRHSLYLTYYSGEKRMVAWIDVSVYRKPMRMDWYLRFESHNLTHMKRGVVNVFTTGQEGSSAHRTTFRRKMITLLESSSRTVFLQILSIMLLLHPHSKQQTL